MHDVARASGGRRILLAQVYRTGSNIAVKECGTEHIEIAPPDVINPANRRPKPGG
jgi:hypothetical protein